VPDDTRQRLLRTAATLFRRQGYAGTPVKQLLDESGVVAGSLYHHFAEGKLGLAAAMVHEQARLVATALNAAREQSGTPAEMLDAWLSGMEKSMRRSGGLDGCPVAPLAIEAPLAGEPLRAAAAAAFDSWARILQDMLRDNGFTEEEARSRSVLVLSAIEGALLLSRTSGDPAALRALREHLPLLVGGPDRERERGA
jgi:TetR/AcrR family transcriptional repressor of lmrAB and yxaGH operons